MDQWQSTIIGMCGAFYEFQKEHDAGSEGAGAVSSTLDMSVSTQQLYDLWRPPRTSPLYPPGKIRMKAPGGCTDSYLNNNE